MNMELGSENSKKSHPDTRWIDGLRGLASVAVCMSHLLGGIHPDLYFSYGDGISRSKSWLKLPIIRLFHSGDAAVAIFFLISGYAISFRPLRRAHCQQRNALLSELGSSAFRRAGRLLLPTLAASFATMLAAQLGAFESEQSPELMLFVMAHRRKSIAEQFNTWIREIFSLFHRNTNDLETPDLLYGTQLWTIPVELNASLVVYLYALALTPLRTLPRLVITGLSACYFLAVARWDLFLFLSGMFLADIAARRESSPPPQGYLPLTEGSSNFPRHQHRLRTGPRVMRYLGLFAALGAGLALASEPTINAAEAPSWKHLNRLVPPSYMEGQIGRFWVAIGAFLVFFSVERITLAQTILSLPLVLHLGDISFGLYLVHNAIMSSVGAWIISLISGPTEKMGIAGTRDRGESWDMGALVAVGLVFGLSWGTAVLFHWFVDRPSVWAMKRLEARLRDS